MGKYIVTGVTFGVFMAEAIIHYNMGKANKDESFSLSLPPAKELAKIAAVTGTFSVISSVLISALESRVNVKV